MKYFMSTDRLGFVSGAKMTLILRWLIDRLLLTSSPTTCPHGRPVILRLTKRDIERGFHRP